MAGLSPVFAHLKLAQRIPSVSELSSSRRNFLKSASAISLAGAVTPYFGWSVPAFANDAKNDRPRIGCIGTGDRARQDNAQHAKFGDVLAVCDVDANHAADARHSYGKGKADVYSDYRYVLDRPDIDMVTVITPDHWHVKIAVEALQAGKHVYCEKPVTLTLEENQLLRAATQKYNKQVFGTGTWQRNDKPKFLRAINMVQNGILGDIKHVTCCINGSQKGGPFKKEKPPGELNWEMWQGQTQLTEYIKERVHYQFRWWYEYSGGKFTDWGAHHVDIATWALQQNTLGCGPVEIDGTDALHGVPYKDGYATVDDSYNASHEFNIKLKFENGITMDVTSRGENGVTFEGSKGTLFVSRKTISGKPVEENWDKEVFTDEAITKLCKGKPYVVDEKAKGKEILNDGEVQDVHFANYHQCIREGGQPVSDIDTHLVAMATCHLCTVAARLGKVIKWDPKNEKIVGDDLAAKFFARDRRKGYEINKV
jgi:predicted dehydrogenase